MATIGLAVAVGVHLGSLLEVAIRVPLGIPSYCRVAPLGSLVV